MFTNTRARAALACCVVAALSLWIAAPALAFHCANASKPIGPGSQAVVDSNFDPVSVGPAYTNQINHGKDTDSLHGGFIGIDCDGDGAADVETYANPRGVVPEQAQENGSADHGVVSIDTVAPSGCPF